MIEKIRKIKESRFTPHELFLIKIINDLKVSLPKHKHSEYITHYSYNGKILFKKDMIKNTLEIWFYRLYSNNSTLYSEIELKNIIEEYLDCKGFLMMHNLLD